jgi:hypothetical protein
MSSQIKCLLFVCIRSQYYERRHHFCPVRYTSHDNHAAVGQRGGGGSLSSAAQVIASQDELGAGRSRAQSDHCRSNLLGDEIDVTKCSCTPLTESSMALLDRSRSCMLWDDVTASSSLKAPADLIALSFNRSSLGQPALCSRGSNACAPASPALVDERSSNSRERRELSVRARVDRASDAIELRDSKSDLMKRSECKTPQRLVAPSLPMPHEAKFSTWAMQG